MSAVVPRAATLGYYQPVPDRASSTGDLTALLQQLRLQDPGGKSPSEVHQAQIDLLLARIASLTDTLRTADWNDTSRTAARLLLADLAMVTAQLRGRATATSETLATTLEKVRADLERTAGPQPATIP
jgi:hypothetical protein